MERLYEDCRVAAQRSIRPKRLLGSGQSTKGQPLVEKIIKNNFSVASSGPSHLHGWKNKESVGAAAILHLTSVSIREGNASRYGCHIGANNAPRCTVRGAGHSNHRHDRLHYSGLSLILAG